MTHPIPPDSVNISINVSRAERNLLGKAACQHDESIGSLVRRVMLRGLRSEEPQTAEQIQNIRRARRARVLLAVGVVTVAAQFWDPDTDLRRARNLRTRRADQVEEALS